MTSRIGVGMFLAFSAIKAEAKAKQIEIQAKNAGDLKTEIAKKELGELIELGKIILSLSQENRNPGFRVFARHVQAAIEKKKASLAISEQIARLEGQQLELDGEIEQLLSAISKEIRDPKIYEKNSS